MDDRRAVQNDIFRAIDQLAVGGYATFGGRLVGADDPRPAAGAEALLDEGMRTAVAGSFAARFNWFDARAVHSIWIKWYLNTFTPPVLLADLLLARTLPVGLARTRFVIGEDQRVAAIKIDGSGEDGSKADPFDRFKPLIFEHFAPLIDMWTTTTGVTRRVLWSNVGNTFEAMLRRVRSVSGSFDRLEDARWLLNESTRADGRPNPIFDAVHDVAHAGGPQRRRRVCCIQYLLPDRRYCKACPIDEPRRILAEVSA